MPSPMNETPLTLTLPAYAWAALRGAARSAIRQNLRRAARPKNLPEGGIDLDADRADTLDYAVERIGTILDEVDL